MATMSDRPRARDQGQPGWGPHHAQTPSEASRLLGPPFSPNPLTLSQPTPVKRHMALQVVLWLVAGSLAFAAAGVLIELSQGRTSSGQVLTASERGQLLIWAIGFAIAAAAAAMPIFAVRRRQRRIADKDWQRWRAERAEHERAEHARQHAHQLKVQEDELKAVLALPENRARDAADPYAEVQELTRGTDHKGGVFLGIEADENRSWLTAEKVHGVLILGPSQSGKTSGVIIPSILSARGPVVSTSTKLDVLSETYRTRATRGRIWLFDPTGAERARGSVPTGVLDLYWSPLLGARSWDSAKAMASAMVLAARPMSKQDQTNIHWTERAKDYLAPLLHAAALYRGGDIGHVQEWISRYEFDAPDYLLARVERRRDAKSFGARLARESLRSVKLAPPEERGSINSTVASIMSVFTNEHARRQALRPNFDPRKFVDSTDSIYITAPSKKQRECGPIIVGLLHDIEEAAFDLGRDRPAAIDDRPSVLWVLDEVANIAPLHDLPDMLSEGGGQGLQIVACLQDLAQARTRWGPDHGLLSKCRTKVIFPGIGEPEDLDALSTILGDWDRTYVSRTSTQGEGSGGSQMGGASWNQESSNSYEYRPTREHQITPSEVSRIPAGHAIVIRNTRWALMETLPHYKDDAIWRRIQKTNGEVVPRGEADALLPAPDAEELPIEELIKMAQTKQN